MVLEGFGELFVSGLQQGEVVGGMLGESVSYEGSTLPEGPWTPSEKGGRGDGKGGSSVVEMIGQNQQDLATNWSDKM